MPRASRTRTQGIVRLAYMFLVMPCACRPSSAPSPETEPEAASSLRRARVLLADQADPVQVKAASEITVTVDGDVVLGDFPRKKWLAVGTTGVGDWEVGDRCVRAESLVFRTQTSACLSLVTNRAPEDSPPPCYAGALQITRSEEGRLRIINLVDVERYVAAVVAREIWPTFADQAYRAQAIVARTFLLYQMELRQDAEYDVTATQKSQVYQGVRRDRTGRRATKAANETRGLVCTWNDGGRDRLFSTYYSAACGGRTQSAAMFGPADDIPPLAGGVQCDYCRIAPGETYRWGPVRLTREEVTRRLTNRYPALSKLGPITDIQVIEQNPAGRPVRLRLTGSTGEQHELPAESFRLALGGMEVRSTDCDIRLTDKDVMFENGRGWGHGLGLCQWGMEGLAREGRTAADILRFYYPGSKITRVY